MRLYSIELYHLCRFPTNKLKTNQFFNKQDKNLTNLNDFLFLHNNEYFFCQNWGQIPVYPQMHKIIHSNGFRVIVQNESE